MTDLITTLEKLANEANQNWEVSIEWDERKFDESWICARGKKYQGRQGDEAVLFAKRDAIFMRYASPDTVRKLCRVARAAKNVEQWLSVEAGLQELRDALASLEALEK